MKIDIHSSFYIENGICAPDVNTLGGRCDCSNAPGWIENDGWMIYCAGDRCYSKQEFAYCIDKEGSNGNKHPVGDGTWCEDDLRHTECRLVKGKTIIFVYCIIRCVT